VSRGCEEWGKRGAGKRDTGGDRGALKGRGDRLCGEERWGWEGGYGERRHATGGSGGDPVPVGDGTSPTVARADGVEPC
jgi:hypothetical protein